MEKKTSVWLIRHGYSIFNHIRETSMIDPNVHYDKFSEELIDPLLHPKGIEQCKNGQKDVNSRNITHVFVSPLIRTLQTTQLMFETHPNLGKIKFIVHPLLREILDNSNDIPNHTLKETRDKFSGLEKYKFDFSLFDKLEIPDLYYLLDLNNPERDNLIKTIKETKRDDVEVVLEAERADPSRKLETSFNVQKRVDTFKEFLANYIKDNVALGDDVAVVTHSLIISHASTKERDSEGKPPYKKMNNCEVFIWNL